MHQNIGLQRSDNEEVLAALGRRIRAQRNKEGISLRKFSEMIGMDRTFLGLIEVGKGNPSVKALLKIADGLNIEIGTLFIEEDLDS